MPWERPLSAARPPFALSFPETLPQLPQLPQPDGPALSANKGLPWTPTLLDGFAGHWSLWDLSGNPALPWADNTPTLLRYFQPLSV